MPNTPLKTARKALACADKLLIVAGAGMSVDSGLPDFRGQEGFWSHYPALASGRLHFEDIANPAVFERHPRLAWGFYEHRRQLYRQATPHAGYQQLLTFSQALPGGAFVFTTNVDGHFQKAGFEEDQIYEVHGSIHYWQCLKDCSQDIWPAPESLMPVDTEACNLLGDLPRCPACARLARPNILMFSDSGWQERRSQRQALRYQQWLDVPGNLVIVEIGAGTDIPTCRWESEGLDGQLIRINLREADCPPGGISIAMGGAEALARLLG